MPIFDGNLPYTNLHELNLDWIVKYVGEVKAKTDDIDNSVLEAKEYSDNAKTSEENAKTSEDNAKISEENAQNAYENIQNTIQPLSEQVALNEQNIAINSGRIDNLATIPPGSISTSADAELVDIRVRANGVTYPSAGDSVRGQITILSNNLESVATDGVLPINYVVEVGMINSSGQEDQNTNNYYRRTEYIDLSTITSIEINASVSCSYWYALYDSSQVFISRSSALTGLTVLDTLPTTGYIRLAAYSTSMTDSLFTSNITINSNQTFLKDKIDETQDSIDLLVNSLELVEETINKKIIPNITLTNGYVARNGSVSSGGTYWYTNKISVQAGDIITTTSVSMRFICAYNPADSVVTSAGSNNDLTTYTVPAGITSLIVTVYENTAKIYIDRVIDKYVTPPLPFNAFRTEGNISNGQILSLPFENISKNKMTAFSGDITSFSAIRIGKRASGTVYFYYEIDNSNVKLYKSGSLIFTESHGLTITNNLQLKLNSYGDDYSAYLTITSNGESYSTQRRLILPDNGYNYVESISSTLTNCVLSFASKDAEKDIYLFGDSYCSFDSHRWIYYLEQDGFSNNCLVNAYGGESTAQALISFENLTALNHKPKYIVWCLGMNDSTFALWKKGFDEVVSWCKEYSVVPVFGTIPTVPSIDNEQKNTYIRNSGYRYIDFAKAVGADSSGNWYSGMLSGDNVHPTEKGARALYGQVLVDFPEIVIS